MSLPQLFLTPSRAAQAARRTQDEDQADFIWKIAGTAELVAAILKQLDGSDSDGMVDPDGRRACDQAAAFARLNVYAYTVARQEDFWAALTKAVFGEYGDSMDALKRLERPEVARPNERRNHTMFKNACLRRAGLASRAKPYDFTYEFPDVFRVGAYVLALMGTVWSFVGEGQRGVAFDWIDRIAQRLTPANGEPSPLLQDAAFALAFMQRALQVVSVIEDAGLMRERREGWVLQQGRQIFPAVFADPRATEFKLFLYRNSVPDDWGPLSLVRTDDPSEIRNHLTDLGELLVNDFDFVVNALKLDQFVVFLFLPERSPLWTHPDVVHEVVDMLTSKHEIKLQPPDLREEAALVAFARRARADYSTSDWWELLLAHLDQFYPDILPDAMHEAERGGTIPHQNYSFFGLPHASEMHPWWELVSNFVDQHGHDSTTAEYIDAVVKHLHGYGPTGEKVRDAYTITTAYELWRRLMITRSRDERFRRRLLQSLQSVPESVFHAQPFLVYVLGVFPDMMGYAHASRHHTAAELRAAAAWLGFHLEETDALVDLVSDSEFIKQWAVETPTGIPSYFSNYKRVAEAFAAGLNDLEQTEGYATALEYRYKLVRPMPPTAQAKWKALLTAAPRPLSPW